MDLEYYKNFLNYKNMPEFLKKYLKVEPLKRLKLVGYFCGMDFASVNVYEFSEYISRFDHSLTVALLVYKLTHDKKSTLQGLFHDISTPVFSHVIDYMNDDYEEQESTEKETKKIITSDTYLNKCLKKDKINIDDIINFKRCSVVDNNRPKLCADRLDGIILTGIGWTKNITKKDIKEIIDDITLFRNEDNEDEIGFKTMSLAQKVLTISKSIDDMCHSKEDNYMMQLLANITKLSIEKGYIKYEDLYSYNEIEIFSILNKIDDSDIKEKINIFKNIKLEEIPNIDLPKVKSRKLNPLVNGKRIGKL